MPMLEPRPCLWPGGGGSARGMLVLVLVLLHAVLWCPEVSSCPMSGAALFSLSCHDDVTFIHSLSGDCQRYIVCHSGVSFIGACPEGYIFSDFSLGCQLPSPAEKQRCSRFRLNNMPLTCVWNPTARLPSYASCAQYFDCAAQASTPGALPDYVTECPYPQLFSTVTGKCEHYHNVRCTGRTEPKAPCDYLHYHQLCQSPSCVRCEDRHPSCVGRSNGNHLLPPFTTVFLVCHSERTVNIGRCSHGHWFSNRTRQCEKIPPPHLALSPTEPASPSSSAVYPPKAKTPSLAESKIRALFESLKNPVTSVTEDDKKVKAPAITVVEDFIKGTLSISGEAKIILDLANTHQNSNGGSDVSSIPVSSGSEAEVLGNLRDGIVNFGVGKYYNKLNGKKGGGDYSHKVLNNPYSRIA